MGRGGNTGVRSGQQAQQASTRLRILRCSGPLPEQSKLLAGAQELNKQVCGNCYNYEYDGFVFVDELGERMRANYLTSAFPKFLENHGLRRMRFHDLRHPYVKHTTKNKSLQKQKSQTTNDNLIVWDFCFFDLCRAVVLKILSAGWHFY